VYRTFGYFFSLHKFKVADSQSNLYGVDHLKSQILPPTGFEHELKIFKYFLSNSACQKTLKSMRITHILLHRLKNKYWKFTIFQEFGTMGKIRRSNNRYAVSSLRHCIEFYVRFGCDRLLFWKYLSWKLSQYSFKKTYFMVPCPWLHVSCKTRHPVESKSWQCQSSDRKDGSSIAFTLTL